jgi:FtsH-binding integral membrane protein
MKNVKLNFKWIYLIGNIILVQAIFYSTHLSMDFKLRYAMLMLFSLFNGFILSTIVKQISEKTLNKAMYTTLIIFFILFVVSYSLLEYAPIIQTPLYLFVLIYTITMLLFSIYVILFDKEKKKQKSYRILMIGLFTLYIVFSTFINFGKDADNDLVLSTLRYYTDIIGLFRNLSYMFNSEASI